MTHLSKQYIFIFYIFCNFSLFFFFFFSVVLIYPDSLFSYFTIIILSVMTAVTFPLRLPRLAFAICRWRWQNDLHEIKYSVSAYRSFIQNNSTCKVLTFCYCSSLYFHNMDVNHLYNFDEESIDLT